MSVRVADSTRTSDFLWNVHLVQGKVDKTSEQVTTSSKLNSLTDDPVALAKVLQIQNNRDQISQYKDNISQAQDWLTATDTALDSATKLIQRAKELAVEMRNDSNSPTDRINAATEVDQLLDSAVDIGNSDLEGNYLFSGNNSSTTPYQVATNGATFTGNTGYAKVEVGNGVYVSYNVPNNRAFVLTTSAVAAATTANPTTLNSGSTGQANTSVIVRVSGVDSNNNPTRIQADLGNGYQQEIDVPLTKDISGNVVYPITVSLGAESGYSISIQGPDKVGDTYTAKTDASGSVTSETVLQEKDLFSALADFRDALKNNDTTAIGTAITEMGQALDTVLRVRADVGSTQNRLELTNNKLIATDATLETASANLSDTDMPTAIMQFLTEQSAYQAMLQMGAKIMQPSLVDYLK